MTERDKAVVIDDYYVKAWSIQEIALAHHVGYGEIVAILQAAVMDEGYLDMSTPFKVRVALAFVRTHSESYANAARAFFLKDERGLRDWVKQYYEMQKAPKQNRPTITEAAEKLSRISISADRLNGINTNLHKASEALENIKAIMAKHGQQNVLQ